MAKNLENINFRSLGAVRCTEIAGIALQLGMQKSSVETRRVSPSYRGNDYYLLRIASTFAVDHCSFNKGKLTLNLQPSSAIAHDMFPRKFEEVLDKGQLQIGLGADLTWGPATAKAEFSYKTTIRSISTSLSTEGLLDSRVAWNFRKRTGEPRLEGVVETLLTIQCERGTNVVGSATLAGWTGRLNRQKETTTLTFNVSRQ